MSEPTNNMDTGKPRVGVLVVEDDELTIDLMHAILDGRYQVFHARSAAEARIILVDEDIDIVLVDISLQGSENGLDFTKEIRSSEQWRRLPIIAVTAHAYLRDKKNALAAGCDHYFSKPINHRDLMSKMDELLVVPGIDQPNPVN